MAQQDVVQIRIILALSACLLLVILSLLLKDCAGSNAARQYEAMIQLSKKAEKATNTPLDPLSIDIRNRLSTLEDKSKAGATFLPPQ
jgi:predicted component of type VI protein secretion system